jgi:sarcosine oxidase subunit beta
MRAKTVIVGGGVIGISIALHTARRTDPLKEPVMLLERDGVGEGPSSRSAAVLGQFYGSTHSCGMARDSLRYYNGLEEKTGRSLGYLTTGVLTLSKSRSEHDRQRLAELVEMQSSIGVDMECVGAARIRTLFPGIELEDDAFGAWEPGAGCLDPQRTVDALGTLARNRGAVIRSGVTVQSIIVKDGRVVGIETADGQIDCEQVVIAGGPWTKQLLEPLGVDLPLRGMRAELAYIGSTIETSEKVLRESVVSMAGPEASGATGWYSRDMVSMVEEGESIEEKKREPTGLRVAHPVLTDPERGFYVRCDPFHNRVSIGRRGTDVFEEVSDIDNFDPTVSAEFMAWARESVVSRLPEYADIPNVGAEAGLFTLSPDNRPILGSLESFEGLYVACAFSGHSFALAPSVGEGMAQMLMGEPVSAFEPEVYTPSRYLGRV